MAAPTFVAAGTPSGSAAVPTPGLPAGLQEWDLMLLHAETALGDSLSTPSGWNLVTGYPFSGGSPGTKLYCFWRRATASESAPTLNDPGDHAATVITAWRGVKRGGSPFNVIGTQTGPSTSSSRSAPSITTTVPNCMIVANYAVDSTGTHSGEANANLTGVAERADFGTSAGGNGAIVVVSGVKVAAGATGATTTSGGTLTWIGAQFALEPIPEAYTDVTMRGI